MCSYHISSVSTLDDEGPIVHTIFVFQEVGIGLGCVANLRNSDDGVMGDDRVPLQIDEEDDEMICLMAREPPTLLLKRNIFV